MAVPTSDNVCFEIGDLDSRSFDLVGMKLKRELLCPAELILTIRKKSNLLDADDIRFAIAGSLMGQGVKVSIETGYRDDTQQRCGETLVFTGIVFGVHNVRRQMGSIVELTLTARSPDALLQDIPHCTSFEDKSLGDIVKSSIGEYNGVINAKVAPYTDRRIQYTVQYNESTYQFLCRLAQRYGEFLYYDDGNFVFGRIPDSVTRVLSPITDILDYQYDLEVKHTRCRLTANDYLASDEGLPMVCVGNDKNGLSLVDAAIDGSESIYRGNVLHHFLSATSIGDTKQQLEEAAGTLRSLNQSTMLRCRLRTNRADLRVGDCIVINEADETNNGRLVSHDALCVIGITTTMTCDGHFESEVTAMPFPDNSEDFRPPYFGNDLFPRCESQRAVVAAVDDPEALGRVRVQFSWQELQSSDLLSPWLRIAQPHGGDDKGFYFIPEIGEEVMVAFENGNAEKPYVVGSLYNGRQHPGNTWPGSNNNVKAIRTRNGHTVEIHDEGEGGYIRIYDNEKENYIITFSTDNKLIKLESTGNIELYAQNDIVMHADNDMKLEVGNNRTLNVGVDDKISIGKNQSTIITEDKTLYVGNDRTDTVGRSYSQSVGENSDINIGGNAKTIVADKHTLKADNILQKSSHKTQIFSDITEHKADNLLKIDGGSSVDIHGDKIKIS